MGRTWITKKTHFHSKRQAFIQSLHLPCRSNIVNRFTAATYFWLSDNFCSRHRACCDDVLVILEITCQKSVRLWRGTESANKTLIWSTLWRAECADVWKIQRKASWGQLSLWCLCLEIFCWESIEFGSWKQQLVHEVWEMILMARFNRVTLYGRRKAQ